MSNGNGNKWIRNLGIVGGVFLTAFLGFGSAMLAVGGDRVTIAANSKNVEANTIAVRNLEQAYAGQSALLGELKNQNVRMNEKLDEMMGILIEHNARE